MFTLRSESPCMNSNLEKSWLLRKSDFPSGNSDKDIKVDLFYSVVKTSRAASLQTQSSLQIEKSSFLLELFFSSEKDKRQDETFLISRTGIFKIEDSAHVAKLWGIRKNRPAMNYDKLSRSIRQYYKKGIIKKPDVSQRLVYQFVHPV